MRTLIKKENFMDRESYNEKAINDAYKNAHIALQSISDLLPEVRDEKMKKELEKESKGYQKIIAEISAYMKGKGLTPQDINFFKKAMLWSSVKMKTLFDGSLNNIAEMMIKGTVTGITELTAMVNEKKNLDEEVAELIVKLLETEEKYEEDLKKFL